MSYDDLAIAKEERWQRELEKDRDMAMDLEIGEMFNPKKPEVIRLPYSVYSHPKCEELIKLITDMGYMPVKTYPEER